MALARHPVSSCGLQKIGVVLIAVLILTLPTGCMVGPDFKPPQVSTPPAWTETGAETASGRVTEAEKNLTTWWTEFSDPTLISLVDEAVRSNLDLQIADSRIRQARAARAIAFSGIGPTLDVSGSYQRSRSPLSTGNSEGITSNFYQSGFDAGWELDIFGGIRRGVEAADADLRATVESRRDVMVTLTAEVALNYINLRAYQQRILIARKNLTAQQHTAELTRRRFEGGFVSGLDVANANAQVATTSSEIPTLESLARQTIYNLSVLLGMEPAALTQELAPAASIPAVPQGAPLGVPSELLRRRPDIRQAEENIHAATARIGVATADLFPRFTITGAAGFQGSDLGSVYNWSGRFWSFGPSITLPLFTMGRIRSNIELRKAIEDETFIAYQQTVLAALQEVENALISLTKEQERRLELVKAVNANNKAVDLATNLYTLGQTDFLNVLAAQRSLFVSEDALAQSTGALSTDMVALYKALGGGWNEREAIAN